jgi:hypothetical protein
MMAGVKPDPSKTLSWTQHVLVVHILKQVRRPVGAPIQPLPEPIMKLLLTPLAFLCVNALACPADSKEAMAAAEHAPTRSTAVAKATTARTASVAVATPSAKPQVKSSAKTAAEARQTASL